MATKPLAQRAAAFKKPDISALTPENMRDPVERVVAAGMKLMYAPEMKQELMKAVQSQDPVPKKLAENVTGMMLMLDQKAKGSIPIQAIFPAAMELMGEAAEALSAAGQEVTQDDFNEGALMLFSMIGQKMGANQEQLMGAAERAIGEGGDGAAEGVPPPPPRPQAPGGAEAEVPEDEPMEPEEEPVQ